MDLAESLILGLIIFTILNIIVLGYILFKLYIFEQVIGSLIKQGNSKKVNIVVSPDGQILPQHAAPPIEAAPPQTPPGYFG